MKIRKKLYFVFIIFSLVFSTAVFSQNFEELSYGKFIDIDVKIGTFLGNFERNYYGNEAPSKLDILWKKHLGSGFTFVPHKGGKTRWSGCGWTGQPLLVMEDGELSLIHI